MGEMGKKARDGTISIDDMAGGTFTISNGGVYGSLLSTPIINPPQVRCVDCNLQCKHALHALLVVLFLSMIIPEQSHCQGAVWLLAVDCTLCWWC